MNSADLQFGAKVMLGNRNWQEAGFRKMLAVLFFGEREQFTHLDMICTVAFWKGAPYLIRVREVRK